MSTEHFTNYSTSKSKEEYLADDESVYPLPRAVIRRNSYVLLDGEWRFALDMDDAGIHQKWYLGHEYNDRVNWPESIEQHIAQTKGIKEPTTFWEDKVVAWYERDFPVPIMETDGGAPSMLQLTFGACGYETRVWLNGTALKTIEGEEVHLGEYTSFSYELDDEILQPVNRLTVRIEDTMNADLTRGKQESSVYKRGGIWYQTYSGAVRSIWLEVVERNRLRSHVGVVSIIEDNLVRFNITPRIHNPGPYVIRLEVYERKGTTLLASSDYPIKLEAGQKEQRLVIEVPGAKSWSPEEPNLYRLVARLTDENGHDAEIETFFGLRKIEARGRHVYLNNKEIYLDGILYQPSTCTYEQIKQHMLAMKQLGCNLVRIHIAGVDPRVYNLADKMGLLLWVEVPSPHRSSRKSRANHRDELLRMLNIVGTHPSVVIWSLYNEDWGIQDVATNIKTRQYIIDMFHYMQLAQPQFLVVDNDGWQHVSYLGRIKSDLLTVHIYTPEIEQWKETLDKLIAGEMNGVAAYPLVVGDPFFYRKQLPLVISEWGGFGFINYGGPEKESERVDLIRRYKEELRKRPIAGDVYTQATNIEDERNGLIDIVTGKLLVPDNLLKSSPPKE